MNSKKQALQEIQTHSSYHVPGQAQFYTIKKNSVFINSNNTLQHEISKTIGALMLHKYGDIKWSIDLINAVEKVTDEIKKNMKGFTIQPTSFITEAVPNNEPDRRVDLVNLNNDVRYEFETDSKIKKDNCITIYL